jgi:alcohol dehydrogenase
MKDIYYEMEKASTLLAPNKTILGQGCVGETGREIKILGGSRALIVTDPGVMTAGLVSLVGNALQSERIDFEIYDRVEAEPPARVVDEAAEVAKKGKFDVIVGFGGGSSLDVAKGVAAMATNDGRVLDHVGVNMFSRRGLPKILIPTTAGTGSEATWVCVVTDEEENTKKSLYSNLLLPDVAILDPSVTASMPSGITAATGFDALVHAIESYVSVNATPYARIMAYEAMRLIATNLPVAYGKGSDLRARYNMLLAANFAGMAFTSGGLGACHGLAYPLGTEFHMPHGKSNAIMLAHVMEFNFMASLERYAEVAMAMGENVGGLSMYEAAAKSVYAVKKLLAAVNISSKLSDYGVGEKDVPILVQGGLKQSRFYVPNPRNLTEADIEAIYRKAL